MSVVCQLLLGQTRARADTIAYLDDHFHEILLGDDIFAVDNLFQDARQDRAAVHVQTDTLQLAEPDKIRAYEDTQFLAFHLALFAIARMALVLQAHPELVHLDKVGQDEADAVLQISSRPAIAVPSGGIFSVCGRDKRGA